MRITTLSLLAVLATAGVANAQGPKAQPAQPGQPAQPAQPAQPSKAEDEKTLYALGASIGESLKVFDLSPAELETVKKGLTDSVTGKKLQVEPMGYQEKIQNMARSRAESARKKSEANAPAEKQKGQAYADKVAKEKGAVKSASGMVFKPIKEGTGAQPAASDTVKVHYKGTLIDGTEFDSSHKRGQPAEFPLNGVIPCWTEGVQKMKVGGKAMLVCPSSIAYGDAGRPPKIPGGATLVFEVELLDVQKAQAPAMPPSAPQAPGKK